MKKIIKTALLALLVLTVTAGCGDAETSGSSPKQEALAFDEVMMGKMEDALDLVSTLDDATTGVSDGSNPDALDELASDLWDIQNSLDEIETDANTEILYVGAVRAYVANARVIVESTAAYLESGSSEDLEKFEHYTDMYADMLDNVTEKRVDFLEANGLTG